MKRVLVVGILLLVGAASPAAAGTVQCVPTQGCPEGVKPPACCQPPPCEFFEHIKMKQATRRLFHRKKIKERLIRKAGGDNPEAAELLKAWVRNKASNLGSQLRCKWEEPYGYAGGFTTTEECAIFAELPGKDAEPMSERQAHEKIDTCQEFISAVYVHEGYHKKLCLDMNSTLRANQGLTQDAREESQGYRKEIASLRASLQRYWNACSSVADASTSRQVAKLGISVLQKKAPKKAKKKARKKPAAPAQGR
jgi:hypothetical protein